MLRQLKSEKQRYAVKN